MILTASSIHYIKNIKLITSFLKLNIKTKIVYYQLAFKEFFLSPEFLDLGVFV